MKVYRARFVFRTALFFYLIVLVPQFGREARANPTGSGVSATSANTPAQNLDVGRGPRPDGTSALAKESTWIDQARKYVGFTYFSFFDGPGIGQPWSESPNEMGNRSDIGWTIWTNFSARIKFSERLALDYQARIEKVLTNQWEFRDQGGRLGVSGKLLKTREWSWTGAVNTDVPGLGQIPTERTAIVTPGLFTSVSYAPAGSRWSLFMLTTPRFFIYRDSMARARQDVIQGLAPGTKPEIVLSFNPSINYAFNDRHGLRAGVLVDYRKNANWDSMKRWFAPVDIGYTYQLSQMLSIYPHIRGSGPWDNGLRREMAGSRPVQPWQDSVSFGMWLSGTLL